MMRIDGKIVMSVVAGLAVFGGLVFLVRRAPSNAVTTPIKKVVDIATTG